MVREWRFGVGGVCVLVVFVCVICVRLFVSFVCVWRLFLSSVFVAFVSLVLHLAKLCAALMIIPRSPFIPIVSLFQGLVCSDLNPRRLLPLAPRPLSLDLVLQRLHSAPHPPQVRMFVFAPAYSECACLHIF